jgi:DNA polymerase-1
VAAQQRDVLYTTILSEAQLDEWLAKIQAAELTALDTETDSLDEMVARIVGISFSVAVGEAAYIPLRHEGMDVPEQLDMDMVLARLKPWLEDAGKKKLGQHVKYDQHVFANHGITVRGYAHDTMLQSYVLEADRPHNLTSLALRHVNRSGISYEDLCGKGKSQIPFAQVPWTRPRRTAARTPTRRWTCTTCCGRASRPMPGCCISTSWKCRPAKRCFASSAMA